MCIYNVVFFVFFNKIKNFIPQYSYLSIYCILLKHETGSAEVPYFVIPTWQICCLRLANAERASGKTLQTTNDNGKSYQMLKSKTKIKPIIHTPIDQLSNSSYCLIFIKYIHQLINML